MKDSYRFENLSPEDLDHAKQMMANEGILPNHIDRIFASPDAAAAFNRRPVELREQFFIKTGAAIPDLNSILDERLKSAPQQKAPDLNQIIDERIADIQKQQRTAAQREQQVLAASVPRVGPQGQVLDTAAAPPPTTRARSFQDYLNIAKQALRPDIVPAAEAVAALGSQAVVAPVAAGAQASTDIVRRYFRGQGPEAGSPLYKEIMETATYQPRTKEAKSALQELGQAFEASKLPPVVTSIPPTVLPLATPPKTKPKVSAEEYQKTRAIIEGVPYKTEQQKQAEISQTGQPVSVGAAGVDIETQRIKRLQELPFPITAEKSQITRNPADVRFARETAKDPVLGQPFQERYAEENYLLQKNLDFFAEQTGSQKLGLPQADFAKSLIELVDANKKVRKQQVSDAYSVARNAGETAELVDIKPLQNWVKENKSSETNAPVIKTVASEIKRLSKNGKISLNDIEEIRKKINDVYDVSPTNARFGSRAIGVIDQVTEGKGGDLYKQARSLSSAYKKEFQDTPSIAKITAMKRGTTQRQIALEDLLDKTLLSGTGEDVRQLFASLERMGPEGQAMINDLRGYVAEAIKREATKGIQLDIYGKRYLSTKDLNTIISDLDSSTKLEFLFGKKGAEQYRTINQAVQDLQTIPKETTNPSGTAAQLLAGMAEMGTQFYMTGIPVPLLTLAKKGYDVKRQKEQMKKIREFLDYGKTKD